MVGFGPKQAWVAVADAKPEAVLAALGARDLGEVGWRQGIDLAYLTDDRLVATPPLPGAAGRDWVLVAGRRFLRGFVATPDVAELSAALGTEVQFFSTYRVAEAHRWERAAGGVLLRAFGYVGESGEITRWEGAPDLAEQAVGLPASADPDAAGEPPTILVGEEDVLAVAAAWSLDPTTLDGRPAPGPLRAAATD